MTTPATVQKRQELLTFIECNLAPEAAIQGVVGIGSIATDQMRPGSDIDAVIFYAPNDPYIVPAEAIWLLEDDSFLYIIKAGARRNPICTRTQPSSGSSSIPVEVT